MKKLLVPVITAVTMAIAVGCDKTESDTVKAAENKTAAVPETAPAVPEVAPAANATIDPDEIVAEMNGKKLIRKDLEEMVDVFVKKQSIPAEQLNAAKDYFRKGIVREFLFNNMIKDSAAKDGIKISDEEIAAKTKEFDERMKKRSGMTLQKAFESSPLGAEKAKQQFIDMMLIEKYIKTAVIDKIEVTKEEIDKVINDVKEANKKAEEANAKIDGEVKAAEAKIKEIADKLAKGGDFAKLAEEFSACPSGKKGGDLGFFSRGMMVKPFEDAAFSQEIGKVGEPVKTDFGYHLIKVVARNAAVEAKGDQPAKPEQVQASHILIKTPTLQKIKEVPTEEKAKEIAKESKTANQVEAFFNKLKKEAKFTTIFKDIMF